MCSRSRAHSIETISNMGPQRSLCGHWTCSNADKTRAKYRVRIANVERLSICRAQWTTSVENIAPKRGKSALNSTSSGVWSAVKHCAHCNAFAFMREMNNIFLMNAQMNWQPLVPSKYIYLPPFPSSYVVIPSCDLCRVELCWQTRRDATIDKIFIFGLFRTNTFSTCE